MSEAQRFTALENAWLEPREPRQTARYVCCWCGEVIGAGEEYAEGPQGGAVCLACIESLTGRELAEALLDEKIKTA